MPDALEIDLNTDGPHSIDVATPTFETTGDFDIVLNNHGPALHVHLNVEPSLSGVTRLATTNHYVDEGGIRRVRVSVDRSSIPADGRMKIVTGYGAETAFATIRLVTDDDTGDRVRVDESLGTPRSRDPEPLLEPDDLPVVAFAAIVLLVMVLVFVLISDPVIRLGILVVLLGVGIAGGLLAR